MSAVKIIGQSAVHTHHTSGRVQVGDDTRKTIVKQGRYADLRALVPRKGSKFEGLTVVSAELVPSKGGMGMLTVTGLDETASHHTGGDGDPEVVYEVEMAQLEKPLLCREEFEPYAEQIELWRAAKPADRVALRYRDENDDIVELDGNAIDAARLILKGVESYLVFAPVARKTTSSTKIAEKAFGPVGGDCGKICNPPAKLLGMVAGSWSWLKTADRVEESSGGGSRRVEEWTGADEWDEDLYG